MLQNDVPGARFLDLFAGSGGIGIEALSRGAKEAVLVDKSKDAMRIIKSNIEKTKLDGATVFCMPSDEYIRRFSGEKFDIIFLDPPYALGLIPKALRTMSDYGLLSVGAKIVCEAGGENDVFAGDEALASRFEVVRTARYGVAYVTILCYRGEEAEA